MKQRLVKTVEVVAQSDNPNRRSQGLDLIEETVALEPEAELRPKLRDEAVKFLVLREVEAHEPELPTGRTHGLVFRSRPATGWPSCPRMTKSSLSGTWDGGTSRTHCLCASAAVLARAPPDSSVNEGSNGERTETGQGTAPGIKGESKCARLVSSAERPDGARTGL